MRLKSSIWREEGGGITSIFHSLLHHASYIGVTKNSHVSNFSQQHSIFHLDNMTTILHHNSILYDDKLSSKLTKPQQFNIKIHF